MLSASDVSKVYAAASMGAPDPIGDAESGELYAKVKGELASAPPGVMHAIPAEFPDIGEASAGKPPEE